MARLRVRGRDSPAQHTGGPPGFGNRSRSRPVDWQNLMSRLAPLRTRWDLAVLANLAGSDSPVRPADLIKAINEQSADGQISWKVLEARLRRLEASGYVARREVPRVPRETRYWLLPRGHRLMRALAMLETWYDEQDPDTDGDDPSG
jgi:DNA-binding HxlR family transcriptional regulator